MYVQVSKCTLCGGILNMIFNMMAKNYSFKSILMKNHNNFNKKVDIRDIVYSQLTLNVTVVSSRCPSDMALFQTAQRYFTPSSSFRGTNDKVLVVGKSFDPPLLTVVSIGVVLPSRYQLYFMKKKRIVTNHVYWKVNIVILTQSGDLVSHQCYYKLNQVFYFLWQQQSYRERQLVAVVESKQLNYSILDAHQHLFQLLWYDTEIGRYPCHTGHFEFGDHICRGLVGNQLWNWYR